MRLTLRTVLAYLDDILPPAKTKELGERITSTPAAAELVDRIRDVIRKRRLSAPDPKAGGDADANNIAEYLDNCLTPEQVNDVERVAHGSDETLAEVAASHQILTLVLGEPVDVPHTIRERMYIIGAAGGVKADHPSQRVKDTTAREQLAAIQGAERPKPVPAAAPPSVEDRVPEYLRRPSLVKRLLPWLLAAAVAIGWIGLLAVDDAYSPFWGEKPGDVVVIDETPDPAGKKPAAAAQKGTNDLAQATSDAGEVKTAPPILSSKPAVPAAGDAATELKPAAPLTAGDLPVDPEPPIGPVPVSESPVMPSLASGTPLAAGTPTTGETAVPPPGTPAASPTGPTGPEVASTTGRAMIGQPPVEPVTPPVGDSATAAAPQIRLGTTTGVVLWRDRRTASWFAMTVGNELPRDVTVIVPEPFEMVFELDEQPVQLSAVGGSRFRTFGQTEAAPVGVDVAQGRFRLAAAPSLPENPPPLNLALRVGKQTFRIELLTPDSRCAWEIIPQQPTAVNQDLRAVPPLATLYVVSGSVRVADAAGKVQVASSGERIGLTGAAPAVALTAPEAAIADVAPDEASPDAPEGAVDASALTPPPALAASLRLPEWTSPQPTTSAARLAMQTFEQEFQDGLPVSQSLLPAVRDRRYYIAEFAVKCLGLTQNIQGLVKAMKDAEHEEAIIAAIEGLRNWLGQDPANGEILRNELSVLFPVATLEPIYRMLWGYSQADARDKETAMQLIDWLDHPELPVRELANYHVVRLSGRRLNYRPMLPPNQRTQAVYRWREFVEQHGGLDLRQD